MEIHKALKEIEKILGQVDPIILYQPWVGRELQNVMRRIRRENHEQTSTDVKRI